MAARKQIDWEAVEKQYRLGQKSLRTIAGEFSVSHTAIRKQAQKEGWIQDKSKEVRDRTRAALVSTKVSNVTQEDVNLAVQTNIEVVKAHRKDARQQSGLMERLINEVTRRTEDVQGVTFKDIQSCFGMLRDSSMALFKLTQIERQAFGIDDDARRLNPIEEVLIAFVEAKVEG